MTTLLTDTSKTSGWKNVLVPILMFWLSGSLLLDFLVMPSLYVSGMMTEPGFATAGYSLFWVFNRVELLCAAIALTAVLGLRYSQHPWQRPGQLSVVLASLLVAIALIDTYALTPTMSALGLNLDNLAIAVSGAPIGMNALHMSYWVLDLLKITAVGSLWWLYQRLPHPVEQN